MGHDIDNSGGVVDRGRLHGGDLMLAQGLAHNVEPATEWCVTKDCWAARLPSGGIVASIDFSGLTSSTCALAVGAGHLSQGSILRKYWVFGREPLKRLQKNR
jgi:hypothetical protein